MTCCGGDMIADMAAQAPRNDLEARLHDIEASARVMADGSVHYGLSVPGIHCGQCIATIERGLQGIAGVRSIRVNLSLKRLILVLEPAACDLTSPGGVTHQAGSGHALTEVMNRLDQLGYPAGSVDEALAAQFDDKQTRHLVSALAVAGFAAGNIMLLSVSVWSGAQGATRDLFHLISALIALPAVAYSGQVFFRSAFTALRAGRLNMDVPISLAILLALGMSLFESLRGGDEAYFDAAVTLMFFLLIGRTLDHVMRARARRAIGQLGRLTARGGTEIKADGTHVYRPLDEIRPGMRLVIVAGERLPVNGEIVLGLSDVDRSLVTGESDPVTAGPGTPLEAGTLNLSGPIEIIATSDAQSSFLAEVMAMMEAAEKGRGAYVRVADRVARLYAPVVHLTAALSFAGWMVITGGDWHQSMMIAIAVLIVTCPCALALAVPVAHVIAAGRLFEAGIMMKDGAALEKLAVIDCAIFDKTGTLTTGVSKVTACSLPDSFLVLPKSTDHQDALSGRKLATDTGMNETAGGSRDLPARVARTLAQRSAHPSASALAAFLDDHDPLDLEAISEIPGYGMEGRLDGHKVRLGRASWVAEIAAASRLNAPSCNLAFAMEGGEMAGISLDETPRAGAAQTIRALQRRQIRCTCLSGDARSSVAAMAGLLGIDDFAAEVTPADKINHIEALKEKGHHVLMVGDGLNDAPALCAADISMAPASASDVGRLAADFVFTRGNLLAVAMAHALAGKTSAVIKQNFAMAIAYNCVAIPLAIFGHVTPLVAAIAMSASSIAVVANSFRLRIVRLGEEERQEAQIFRKPPFIKSEVRQKPRFETSKIATRQGDAAA